MSETQTAKIKWHPVVAEPHTVTEEDVEAGIFTVIVVHSFYQK